MKTLYVWGISEYGISYRTQKGDVEISSACSMEDGAKQTVMLRKEGETTGIVAYDMPKIIHCGMFDALSAVQFLMNIRDAAEKYGCRISSTLCWVGENKDE